MGAALACGLATVDVVQVVEAVPGPDEKVLAPPAVVSAGGPACNAAMVAAALGVETRFVGAVGSGPLSSIVLRDLASRGVAVVDVAPPTAEPTLATVLVTASTGERAVVSGSLGGPAEVLEPVSPARAEAILAGAGAVLVDGHHLRVAVEVAREARARGIPVLLDGGSWKPGLEALLAHVDVAVVSAVFRLPDRDGPEGVLAALLGLGPRWVARSDGPRPVEWRDAAGRSGTVPVPAVDVVDTLGAGDVLHGALLAGLARDGAGDLPVALARAVDVAARSVGAPGALGWADRLR